jgi:DNA polymerase-3 subunit alpha
LEFCRRVSTRKVNKKVLESLTLAGAFDTIAEVNRASLFSSLEDLLKHAGEEQEERELGQSSLFDSFTAEEVKLVTPAATIFKKEEDWPMSRKLAQEKQVVGFYVSGHPLDSWQKICEDWLGWTTERIKHHVAEKAARKAAAPAPQEMSWGGDFGGGFGGPGRYRAPKQEVKLVGLIGGMREVMTKKGSRMAFGELEDLYGRLEVVFFPESYANNQEMLKRAATEVEAIVVTAELETADEAPKLLVKTLEWAAEAHKGKVQQVVLKISPSEVSPDQLRELKKNLLQHRGKCPVRIDFVDMNFRTRLDLPKALMVSGTPQMVQSINRIFGRNVVVLS